MRETQKEIGNILAQVEEGAESGQISLTVNQVMKKILGRDPNAVVADYADSGSDNLEIVKTRLEKANETHALNYFDMIVTPGVTGKIKKIIKKVIRRGVKPAVLPLAEAQTRHNAATVQTLNAVYNCLAELRSENEMLRARVSELEDRLENESAD